MDVFCCDQNFCVFYIYSNNVEDKLQHAHIMKVEINMNNIQQLIEGDISSVARPCAP